MIRPKRTLPPAGTSKPSSTAAAGTQKGTATKADLAVVASNPWDDKRSRAKTDKGQGEATQARPTTAPAAVAAQAQQAPAVSFPAVDRALALLKRRLHAESSAGAPRVPPPPPRRPLTSSASSSRASSAFSASSSSSASASASAAESSDNRLSAAAAASTNETFAVAPVEAAAEKEDAPRRSSTEPAEQVFAENEAQPITQIAIPPTPKAEPCSVAEEEQRQQSTAEPSFHPLPSSLPSRRSSYPGGISASNYYHPSGDLYPRGLPLAMVRAVTDKKSSWALKRKKGKGGSRAAHHDDAEEEASFHQRVRARVNRLLMAKEIDAGKEAAALLAIGNEQEGEQEDGREGRH